MDLETSRVLIGVTIKMLTQKFWIYQELYEVNCHDIFSHLDWPQGIPVITAVLMLMTVLITTAPAPAPVLIWLMPTIAVVHWEKQERPASEVSKHIVSQLLPKHVLCWVSINKNLSSKCYLIKSILREGMLMRNSTDLQILFSQIWM